jgi:hypothetical protein
MLPSKQAVFIESAASLDEAKNRLRELVQMFPGDYFIFDRDNCCFVIPSNSLPQAAEKQETVPPSPGKSDHEAPDAGSRFAVRRSVPRFVFAAPIEITEPITKSHVIGRVIEIGQRGCFARAEKLLTINAVVQLRIHRSGDVFETWARVVYNHTVKGMGLHFIDPRPEQSQLLTSWLEALKGN